MALANVVAENLHAARIRRNMSQEKVAEKAGLSVSYISMLERGERIPPLDTLEALAKALKMSALDLLQPSATARTRARIRGQ